MYVLADKKNWGKPLNRIADGLQNYPRLFAWLAGVTLGLGQAPFNFPWTALVAVPVLAFLVHHQNKISGFAIGWFAGFGYFLCVLHWIVEPFLVDPIRTGWMAPFALFLMTGGLALFWAIGMLLARLLARSWLQVVALPFALTGAEILRSFVFTGFPWALPAYIWMETPLSQLLAFVGPFGLTYLTLQIAALPIVLNRAGLGVALVLASVTGGWFFTSDRLPEQIAFSDTTVRLVQPNAAQHEKWQREMVPVFWKRQLEATAAPGDVDVVIWPEVAVPYLFDEAPQLNAEIALRKPGATFIIGARHIDRAADRWFNSAAVLNGDGSLQAYYDKAHLVPFGEYLPFPSFWEKFGLRGLAQNAGRYSAGSGDLIGAVDAVPEFITAICYEIIFPDRIREANENARWIVHLTNDAWFGNFSGPYQHFAQTRARAIELGLPIARVANTGISAVIDPFGQTFVSLELGIDGHIDAPLPEPLESTVYANLPQMTPLLLLLPFLILGFVAFRRTV